MVKIQRKLHLEVETVTSKSLGENLEDLKKNGFYEHCDEILREKSRQLGNKPKATLHDAQMWSMREAIITALARNNGNKSRTTRDPGISRPARAKKLKKLSL